MHTHSICYTALVCLLGFSLALVYGLTHDVGNMRVYQIVYEQPQHQARQQTVAGSFSAVDEQR